MNLIIFLTLFGIIFVSELPDKSLFASLVLSRRFSKLYVWLGAAVAFSVHVVIAVTAGRLLDLLPHRFVSAVVTLLFLGGVWLVLSSRDAAEAGAERIRGKKAKALLHSHGKVFTTAFVVVFIGEWGDISQIVTANYAAQYHDPISVALGALAGMWLATALAIVAGNRILKRFPARFVQRVIAAILVAFAIASAVSVVRG